MPHLKRLPDRLFMNPSCEGADSVPALMIPTPLRASPVTRRSLVEEACDTLFWKGSDWPKGLWLLTHCRFGVPVGKERGIRCLERCSETHLLLSIFRCAVACLPTMRGGKVSRRCCAGARLPTELLSTPSGALLFPQLPDCAGLVWPPDKFGASGKDKPTILFHRCSSLLCGYRGRSLCVADGRRSQSRGRLFTRRTCAVSTPIYCTQKPLTRMKLGQTS